MSFPNEKRNKEVEDAISKLKESDAGAHAEKKAGIATALSNLDLAESMQLLQLQISETARQNRVALENSISSLRESNEALAKSNEKHAKDMKWLTVALVLVAIAQAFFTYTQFGIGESSVDAQKDATSLENAKWQYEMMRNDRLEQREVEWRREDLERSKTQPQIP